MVPCIGPEFIAHLLNDRPNGENQAGKAPAARVRSGAFDKPRFLLKVRLTFVADGAKLSEERALTTCSS